MVVGAGMAGLVAARDLAAAGVDVVVLEATESSGGKLRAGRVAGITVDVGAEAMLHRRPEGIELARGLGLALAHPTSATSRVWTRGALRRLPRTLMGAPLDLDDLAATGILDDAGLQRARRQVPQRVGGEVRDLSVGDAVAARFGDEVVDRLVEPLLGGVYAGHARQLSLRAAVPQLVDLLGREQFTVPVPTGAQPPVFAGIPGGMWQLPQALESDLRAQRVDLRHGVAVTGLRRVGSGFVVTTAAGEETADQVVIATPAAASARLLADVVPVAASVLSDIDYASVALVTLAFRSDDPTVIESLDVGAAGFLVPPVDGRRIKASTFSFAKWDWVREAGDGLLVLRTSLGRQGEEASLQVPDDVLIAASLADLALATGLRAQPVDAVVQRWGGGLPQYRPGHLDDVTRIRASVADVPGLAVCGAAYDGVGIPAVIASAQRAVAALLT